MTLPEHSMHVLRWSFLLLILTACDREPPPPSSPPAQEAALSVDIPEVLETPPQTAWHAHLELPSSSARDIPVASLRLAIHLNAWFLDNNRVDTLSDALIAHHAEAQGRLLIAAGHDVPFRRLDEALRAARDAGYRELELEVAAGVPGGEPVPASHGAIFTALPVADASPACPVPDPESAPEPTLRFGRDFAVMGAMDISIIRRVLARHREPWVTCYRNALAAQPDLHGTAHLSFVIGPTGRIQSAAIESAT